jgi:adenylate cyclase
MNAPPNVDPVTPHSDSDIMHWLTNDTRDERFIDNIFAELCVRLQRAGIPVKRASLHILIHHPQWLGARSCRPTGCGRPRLRESTTMSGSDRNTAIVPPTKSMTVPPRCARISNVIPRWAASTPSMTRCGRKARPTMWHGRCTIRSANGVTFATDRRGGFDDAYRRPVEIVTGSDAGQRNPHQEPAGANAARNLCRVACRRAHSGRSHQARKRDDGTRRHHDLRSA